MSLGPSIRALPLVFLAACGGGDAPLARRPSVLVYLVDTTRADHLSAYGYARETTPRLEEFARESVLFERAWSPSSWTRAATASLLTGLDPVHHGARSRNHKVSLEAPLLAEILAAEGYACAAIVTNPHVVETWGFARGFEVFEDLGALAPTWQDADARRVIDRVEGLLDGFATDPRPFFLYVHTIDPHGPNTPPAPYDRLFTDDPRTPPLPGALTPDTPPAELENLRALYDGELRFADEHFGRLLDGLRARGLYDDTLVVFTSDHGEEHLEHGRGGHGQQLFDVVVRVPLVIRFADGRGAGTRTTARASLLDVVPTVLAAVGVEAHPACDGVDLAPAVAGAALGDAWEARPFFLDLELVRHDGELHRAEGVIRGAWKYVAEEEPLRRRFLFDLVADPGETTNLLDERPEIVDELQALVATYRGGRDAGVHLRAASDKAGANPTTLRVRVRAEAGRVTDVRGIELEDEDTWRVDPITGAAEVTLVLRETPRAGGKRQRLKQDVDEIVVRVAPPTARLVIEGAEGLPGPVFGRGAGLGQDPWPVALDSAATDWPAAERHADVRRLDAGLYLWVEPPPETEALEALPDDLRKRFEELGYAGDF